MINFLVTYISGADSNVGSLRSIENVAKKKKNVRENGRMLTFDDDSSEEESDDDDADYDESIEQVDDVENLTPAATSIRNGREDNIRPSKRSLSKSLARKPVDKTVKRSCTNISSLQDSGNKDGNHLLKKLLLSIDDLNKESYQSSKDVKNLVVSIEKIDKKLNILYENQKKMQRALSKKKVTTHFNEICFSMNMCFIFSRLASH